MAAGALIPTNKLVRCEFVLTPYKTRRMGASGNSVEGFFGPSRWRLFVETERLTMDDARVWSPWLNDRRDLGHTFTAFNLFRVNPKVPIPLDAPDGDLSVLVVPAFSAIVLDDVGTWQAKAGDFISYRTLANGYYAGEVMQDSDAPDDGELPIALRPLPPAVHATTPAVRRTQALAEFELTTDPGPFEDYVGRTLSFEAMQVIR